MNVLCDAQADLLLLTCGLICRYREMQTDAGFEGSVPPFLYGTHYSTPGYEVQGTAGVAVVWQRGGPMLACSATRTQLSVS